MPVSIKFVCQHYYSVFRKLCFDFPEVLTEDFSTLSKEFEYFVTGAKPKCKDQTKFATKFYLNQTFVGNLIFMATSHSVEEGSGGSAVGETGPTTTTTTITTEFIVMTRVTEIGKINALAFIKLPHLMMKSSREILSRLFSTAPIYEVNLDDSDKVSDNYTCMYANIVY